MKIFCFVFLFSYCSHAAAKQNLQYFYCHPISKHPDKTLFSTHSYRTLKVDIENLTGNFYYKDRLIKSQIKNGFLSAIYFESQRGFSYTYKLYRFNPKTKKLIFSYIYHGTLDEYKSRLDSRKNNSHAIPFSQTPVSFAKDLIKKEETDNKILFGFDKLKWECREVSYIKYIFLVIKGILYQILSV